MRDTLSFVGAFGLGATFAFLFDRDDGRRRRALIRGQAVRSTRSTIRELQSGVHDLNHRAHGLLAQARHLRREKLVADIVVRERVRSRLGRLVAHAHAVHVDVQDGVVSLSGEVLPDDARVLLDKIALVRGVRHVEDHLSIHCAPEAVPSLQGEGVKPGLRRAEWKPRTRLAVLALSGAGAFLGWRARGWVRAGTLTAGGLLTLRALSGKPYSTLLGFGGRRLVEFHKTIEIDAPIDQVFSYWANYDHFPEFMSHVRAVERLSNGRSHWTVAGPFGAPVRWVAETSAFRPNEVIAWRSAPGSLVKHSGIVQFQTWGNGTKLELEMTYNPPGGFFGHALGWLFRKDPKHALDDDLVRLKSLLEVGRTSVQHRAVLYAEASTQH